MKLDKRNRYWLGGLLGLAVAVGAPTATQATERGGERFDRNAYERSDNGSTWRREFTHGWGRGSHRADARSGRGRPGAVPTEVRGEGGGGGGGGDPQTPEPTAALLVGAGLRAGRGAVRKGRAR
jgi:hypothetical protein